MDFIPNFTQIPNIVFDELMAELSTCELKILLYLIYKGGLEKRVEISTRKLIEDVGCSASIFHPSIRKLIARDLVMKGERRSDREVFSLLNKKNSKKGCLFCGIDDIPLERHHFPIRRVDGGKETIKLCPNCHRKFHELADYTFPYRVKL